MFSAIIDISRQIGHFQFFTFYSSQSCVFERKSPFDVWFDWKVLFKVFTSAEPKTVFLNIILREMSIMFKKHSFGFCRCKDFKKHFSIKSDIKWRFWLKNTALAAVKCKKLKLTDISRQIGHFQFFTAYNSQSCVFEPKSPFDVWFDWKVLFPVFTCAEPKTVFLRHNQHFT